MSVIVQVGQAGCQIGDELWRILGAERKRRRGAGASELFSEQPGGGFEARCVMIDSESKGLGGLLKQPWISRDNVVTDPNQMGRGNNWAYGYARDESAEPAQFDGGSLVSRAVERVRKVVESLDIYEGCTMLHSLSGGTGSGVGTRLLEELREAYPMHYLTSCPVVPFHHGEAALQHYNSAMTMAALQQHADAVLLTHNQEVLKLLVDRKPRQRDSAGSAAAAVRLPPPLPEHAPAVHLADACALLVLSPGFP